MTTMDQIHHIRELYYEQDKKISEIMDTTGLSRNTVTKYVDMTDFNPRRLSRLYSSNAVQNLIHISRLLTSGLWMIKRHCASSATLRNGYITVCERKQKDSTAPIGLLPIMLKQKRKNCTLKTKIPVKHRLSIILGKPSATSAPLTSAKTAGNIPANILYFRFPTVIRDSISSLR